MHDKSNLRLAAASIKMRVADVLYNTFEIIEICKKACEKKVDVLAFSQLCITGFTCEDLFLQASLIESAYSSIKQILLATKSMDMLIIIGAPFKADDSKSKPYNCAIYCYKGEIVNISKKSFSNERYFKRYLKNNEALSLACDNDEPFLISAEFGKDIINLDAHISIIMDADYATALGKSKTEKLLKLQSKINNSAIIYVNCPPFESTTDFVMPGNCYIISGGEVLKKDDSILFEDKLLIADVNVKDLHPSKQNKKDIDAAILEILEKDKKVRRNPFIPDDLKQKNEMMQDIFEIQTAGLMRRLMHIGAKKVVAGISGGLDSTLALLVAYNAFKKLGLPFKNIIAITMPGFGTSGRTYENAKKLIDNLGVDKREISIKEASLLHLKNIGHDLKIMDTTFENAQARERTQVLMDVANMENAIVVGTGDLSELVLGFTTYNGDHMSMYSVNASVPKTVAKALTEWLSLQEMFSPVKDILLDIVKTPVSPELLPPSENGEITQKTEDIIGPYELNDFFTYYVLKKHYKPLKIANLAYEAYKGDYDKIYILKCLKNFYKRFFSQQFKRSCMPDGVAVFSVSVSPRASLKMPSDAVASLWISEIEREISMYTD